MNSFLEKDNSLYSIQVASATSGFLGYQLLTAMKVLGIHFIRSSPKVADSNIILEETIANPRDIYYSNYKETEAIINRRPLDFLQAYYAGNPMTYGVNGERLFERLYFCNFTGMNGTLSMRVNNGPRSSITPMSSYQYLAQVRKNAPKLKLNINDAMARAAKDIQGDPESFTSLEGWLDQNSKFPLYTSPRWTKWWTDTYTMCTSKGSCVPTRAARMLRLLLIDKFDEIHNFLKKQNPKRHLSRTIPLHTLWETCGNNLQPLKEFLSKTDLGTEVNLLDLSRKYSWISDSIRRIATGAAYKNNPCISAVIRQPLHYTRTNRTRYLDRYLDYLENCHGIDFSKLTPQERSLVPWPNQLRQDIQALGYIGALESRDFFTHLMGLKNLDISPSNIYFSDSDGKEHSRLEKMSSYSMASFTEAIYLCLDYPEYKTKILLHPDLWVAKDLPATGETYDPILILLENNSPTTIVKLTDTTPANDYRTLEPTHTYVTTPFVARKIESSAYPSTYRENLYANALSKNKPLACLDAQFRKVQTNLDYLSRQLQDNFDSILLMLEL